MTAQIFLIAPPDTDAPTCLRRFDEAIAAAPVAALLLPRGTRGEGNYKATRQYNEGVKDHMQHHDVEKEARDAAPKSDAEARDMERAEEEGRSRAKGGSKDAPEDPGKA